MFFETAPYLKIRKFSKKKIPFFHKNSFFRNRTCQKSSKKSLVVYRLVQKNSCLQTKFDSLGGIQRISFSITNSNAKQFFVKIEFLMRVWIDNKQQPKVKEQNEFIRLPSASDVLKGNMRFCNFKFSNFLKLKQQCLCNSETNFRMLKARKNLRLLHDWHLNVISSHFLQVWLTVLAKLSLRYPWISSVSLLVSVFPINMGGSLEGGLYLISSDVVAFLQVLDHIKDKVSQVLLTRLAGNYWKGSLVKMFKYHRRNFWPPIRRGGGGGGGASLIKRGGGWGN